MEKKKSIWIKNGTQLSFFLDLKESQDADIVTLYNSYIKKWQSLFCPEIISIDKLEITNNGKDTEFCLTVNKIDLFCSVESLKELSVTEKLFLFQRLINVNHFFEKNDLIFSWNVLQLYKHDSGCYCWLPLTPDFLLKSVNNKKSIVDIFFNIFEIPISDGIKLDRLLRKKDLPREWSIFLEYYLNQDGEDIEKINKVFSLIFYQSWIYILAHHAGMSGESSLKLLTPDNYEKLYQLGINLGLSDDQIKELDFLAHLEQLTPQNFIDIIMKS